jgi:uncharacterized protein YidB (DUF937 family)
MIRWVEGMQKSEMIEIFSSIHPKVIDHLTGADA